MIGENCEWVLGSLKPVSPLLEGELDGQKFSVADVVISI